MFDLLKKIRLGSSVLKQDKLNRERRDSAKKIYVEGVGDVLVASDGTILSKIESF